MSLTNLLLAFVAVTVALAALTAAVVLTVRIARSLWHGHRAKFA